MTRLVPSPRVRTVLLGTMFAFTTFFVGAAPAEVPLPRPAALAPQPADALACASNPSFIGHLTSSTGSTAVLTKSTTGNVYGYISEVVDDWSCTAYYRYDGLAWARANLKGNFDWGNLIHSTSVPCNWTIGSTNYLKANETTDCADSDAEYAMATYLVDQKVAQNLLEAVYHNDASPDQVGDFGFAHSDCTSYYGATDGEVVRYDWSFADAEVNNRPGDNCDPIDLDTTNTTQALVVDATIPTFDFDWPDEAAPTTVVTTAGVGVQFDATDALAGFDATHTWFLQRWKATWTGSACGTFSQDGTPATGTTNAANQVVSQGLLADGSCYRWDLGGADANGNTAFATNSGIIRVDTSGNLGQQDQHDFESWDLGAGDSLAVNVGTGNLVITHPVVSLPIRGSSVDIDLTYNRQDASDVGMTPGWRLNMLRRLTVNADSTVTFTDGDGARHTFTNPQTAGTVTTYTRPATTYATLVKDTAISANEFVLTYRDGSKDKFDISGSSGLLVREEDRFGNGVTLAYTSGQLTSISDTAGSRTISIAWTSGNLTSITDWANVNGSGVVQTSGSGNRATRFFYSGGQLIGWADPLNTSGSCPTGGSHLTCIAYPTGGLDVSKTQTISTIGGSPATLGSTTQTATTKVSFINADVTTVKDAQEVANATAGTAFSHTSPFQTQVVRRGTAGSSLDTTTRYTLLSASDAYARVGTVARKLGAAWITTTTTYDATYPIEDATVTEDVGGSLQRTTTTTYLANSLGLVSRIDAPLDGTYRHYTDFTYNANNDVTQQIVSRQGDASLRTTTRNCYTSSGCATNATDLVLRSTIENYQDGTKGGTNGHVEDITTEYQYDSFGRRIRETRYNYGPGGTLLDSRATGDCYSADCIANDGPHLVKQVANFVSGTVTNPGDDITPNATTYALTDLTTVYTYDTAGNRVTSDDPRRAIEIEKGTSLTADDFVTRWTYDALDQRVTEKTPTTPGITITCASASPNCRDSASTYDEFGAVRLAVDFGNLVTASEFDRVGRATQTFEDPPDIGATKPADTTSQSTFDPAGRVLTTKDQIQVDDSSKGSSTFLYDELGRQYASAEAVGTATATETDTSWDALGRQTSQTIGVASAAAQTTITTYDVGDRATRVDDDFACTSTTYDWRSVATQTIEGQASGVCTGNGLRTTTHTPDGLGRITLSEVTAGTTGIGDKPVQQTFDGEGHVLTSSSYVAATTTTTSLTSTYNPLDQVVKETRTDGSVAKTTYDPVGNGTDRCYWASAPTPDEACQPVGSSFTTPPTRHTSATFDARNNRISLTDATTKATTLYDPDHNYLAKAIYVPTKMSGLTVNVEHQSTFGYDERHRLVSMTHQVCTVSSGHSCSSTTATGSVTYEYDQNDNRTRVNENNGNASADRRYCYDPLDRLQYRNTAAACSSSAKDESYAYDDGGNRTQTVIGAVTTDFAYNADGQLCKVGATTCGTPNVTYDTAGRTATYNGWWYTYDADGRLLTACKSATCASTADKIEMVYDAEGRRTKVITDPANAAPASTREFRYQGDAIVEERVDGVLDRQYLVDESGSVVELVIPSGGSAGTYLVTYNGHGDALALWKLDPATGALTLANSYTYGTWGQPSTATHNGTADLGFRFLYVGEFDVQWDNELTLGLIYMHARHYGPALGRFLQPDPDRSEANLYAYATNNPVTEVDPDGTCFILCVLLIPLAIGAAIDAVDYLTSTDKPTLEGGLTSMAMGAPLSIMPWGKLAKASKLAKIATKVASKFPKAARVTSKLFTRTRTPTTRPAIRRGGENAAAARGRAEHAALRRRVLDKGGGWRSEPTLMGRSGRTLRPDVVTPRGRFIELKPNTISGRIAGIRQAARYRRELGMRGRVIYYDPR